MISVYKNCNNLKLLLNNNKNILLKSCFHQSSQLLNIKKKPLRANNKLYDIDDIVNIRLFFFIENFLKTI